MKWFTRYRETIVPLLVLVVAGLFVANLVRHGLLTTSQLSQSKDALAALQSAVQVVFIVVGAVFSYYRFFRGRTFISRGDVSIDVAVIDTPTENNLHWIAIEFKNLGTVSVWDPKPEVVVRRFGPAGVTTDAWPHWRDASTGHGGDAGYSVIDSGETASFTTFHEVSKSIWAVEYEVFVTDSDGIRWKRSAMIENKTAPARHADAKSAGQ